MRNLHPCHKTTLSSTAEIGDLDRKAPHALAWTKYLIPCLSSHKGRIILYPRSISVPIPALSIFVCRSWHPLLFTPGVQNLVLCLLLLCGELSWKFTTTCFVCGSICTLLQQIISIYNNAIITENPKDKFKSPILLHKCDQDCHAELTSAALAAAPRALSGEVPSPPDEPSARPGVDDRGFWLFTAAGTGAREGVSALLPSTRPGVEKLSSLFADLEHMFPILAIEKSSSARLIAYTLQNLFVFVLRVCKRGESREDNIEKEARSAIAMAFAAVQALVLDILGITWRALLRCTEWDHSAYRKRKAPACGAYCQEVCRIDIYRDMYPGLEFHIKVETLIGVRLNAWSLFQCIKKDIYGESANYVQQLKDFEDFCMKAIAWE